MPTQIKRFQLVDISKNHGGQDWETYTEMRPQAEGPYCLYSEAEALKMALMRDVAKLEEELTIAENEISDAWSEVAAVSNELERCESVD